MTSKKVEVEFGYYPSALSIDIGDIQVQTLPGIKEKVHAVTASDGVDAEWLYPPAQMVHQIGGGIQQKPYASRIFGLPKTHVIRHAKIDGDDHLAFLVWVLSFFLGIRLTTTEMGYLDATPIKPGRLVDFAISHSNLPTVLALADTFWTTNRVEPALAKRFAAAVHALFLSQNPHSLQFERFIYLYIAVDACYSLASSLVPLSKRVTHANRIGWVCSLFGMTTPVWASPKPIHGAEVAMIRNATLHEALFMGEPLGFALHGIGSNQNLTLEMKALVCRLLVALIGAPSAEYVRTPIDTRQRQGLNL